MKKILRYLGSLSMILIVFFNVSCDILTPLDPALKTEKEAWDVIIEAHAMKQLWFHNFFRIYSNNYSRGQLFTYEPTKAQLDLLYEEFNELMNYTDAVEAAVDSIEVLANDLSKVPFGKPTVSAGLFSALKDFFGAGSEVNENNRKRIMLIVSNMSQADRDQLYDELVINKWQKEIGTASEFWTKLQNGDLDDKASTLYRNFYDGANAYLNPFTGLANDKNLTPGKILAKDGMNLCNKGMDVVLETGKAIVPGLGQATDIIDAGKDYYGKAEKMVDKPMEFLADEIKSRGAAYIAGIIDIDSRLDSEGAGKYVKTIAELTLGSDDPQELIERGIDAGIARIKSTDNSIKADIVIAENKQPGAGLPDYIFGIGTYAQEANEFIMNLPSGNWDITAKDNIGYSSVPVSVTVVTQQESTVDVAVSDTSSTSGDPKQGPPTLEDILDSLNMDFSDKPMIHFYFNDGQSAGSTTANEIDHVGYAILWSGNSFSSSLSTAYIDSSYIPHYREVEWDIWGYLTLDTVTWQPVISAECSYTTNSYIGTDNTYLKNELTITYSASTLPLDPWDMDGRYKSSVQFHTRALAESDYENHADYSNDYYVYQDSTTTIVYESHLEGFLNVSSGGFMKIIIQKPLNYIDTVITVY